MIGLVRTTLDIDDDVLQAAKELAQIRQTTAGRVVSDLMRKALEPARSSKVRNGVPVLPRRYALMALVIGQIDGARSSSKVMLNESAPGRLKTSWISLFLAFFNSPTCDMSEEFARTNFHWADTAISIYTQVSDQ